MERAIGTEEAPRVFISYSWDSDAHKNWVSTLVTRLRSNGVNVILDQWHVRLGDQLPQFMETAVRDSNFVLIICTPRYKERSDRRLGGVGYEGHIITAEVFRSQTERKFIPALRSGDWDHAAPSWLAGKNFADLRGEPYRELQYGTVMATIHHMLPEAPPIGPKPPYLVNAVAALVRFVDRMAVVSEKAFDTITSLELTYAIGGLRGNSSGRPRSYRPDTPRAGRRV